MVDGWISGQNGTRPPLCDAGSTPASRHDSFGLGHKDWLLSSLRQLARVETDVVRNVAGSSLVSWIVTPSTMPL